MIKEDFLNWGLRMADHRGALTLFIGTMGCGKSGDLLKSVKKAKRHRRRTVIGFKFDGDTRDPGKIASRDYGLEMQAYEIPADKPNEIFEILKDHEKKIGKKCNIVVIDEGQFFAADEFFWVVDDLLKAGYDVMIAGLDLNFTGRPFGAMLRLITLAQDGKVFYPDAWCKCGERAIFPQRLLPNGELAPWDGPEIEIGDVNTAEQSKREKEEPDYIYEPRCPNCFVRPPKKDS